MQNGERERERKQNNEEEEKIANYHTFYEFTINLLMFTTNIGRLAGDFACGSLFVFGWQFGNAVEKLQFYAKISWNKHAAIT